MVVTSIPGNDTMTGTAANDTYEYHLGDGQDTISDAGGNDLLFLSDPYGLYAGLDIYRSGNDLVFDAYSAGKITILNQFSAVALPTTRIETVTTEGGWGPFTIQNGLIGTNAADLLVGTSAAETITGGAGGDWIWGAGGNDYIDAGNGDNESHGGAGDDTLLGGAGNDDLYGGQGNDSLFGGDGYDSAYYDDQSAGIVANLSGQTQVYGDLLLDADTVLETGDGSIDTLSGIEQVTGTNYADYFLLGRSSGETEVYLGKGNDTVDGGLDGQQNQSWNSVGYWDDPSGIIINLSRGALVVTIDNVTYKVARGTARDGWGNTDTYILYGNENLNIMGSSHADYIRGRDDSDTDLIWEWLAGGQGNDTIDGGTGTDTAGYSYNLDDTLHGIIANLSSEAITIGGATVAANTVNDNWGDVDTLLNIENISGSEMDDIIVGSSGSNALFGDNGDDTLVGGAGNDYLNGGDGSDTAVYDDASGSVTVTLYGAGSASVMVNGTFEDNISNIENIVAGSGNDVLTGDWLDNSFTGNAGNDTLDGGSGSDTADYSDKSANVVATLNGSTTVNVTVGGVVEDSIRNIENLVGGSGNDNFTGDAQDNTFQGGAGNDTLNGGGGSDTADYSEKTSGVAVTLNGSTLVSVSVGGIAEDSIRYIENINGGSAGDTLNGDSYANKLVGNEGNDTLNGGSGNDTLVGGAGADVLDGGAGYDTAVYTFKTGSVVVALNGATAVNVTVGGLVEDSIKNIENIVGGMNNDTLTGDSLNNFFRGGEGADTINGGSGTDTADYSDKDGAVVVTLNGGTAVNVTVDGMIEDSIKYIENINAGNGNDSLTGDSGNNVLKGGAGMDTLNGGSGVDTADYSDKSLSVVLALNGASAVNVSVDGITEDSIKNIENIIGGSAADTLTGDSLANSFKGGSGADTIDGGAGTDTADYSDKSTAVSVALNGATAVSVTVNSVAEDSIKNIENIIGGSAADTLTGDSLANSFKGGNGADTIDGGSGTDTADYSDKSVAVSVALNGATAVSVKVNSIAEDSIKNIENIIGGSAADTLTGDSLANSFKGGNGADTIDGGTGTDTADYTDKSTAVSVTLSGATSATVTVGGVAEDSIVNIENLLGGSAADKLTGDSNANKLLGNSGNDTLSGADGNDTLSGGAGLDNLTGGVGSDSFVFDYALGSSNIDTVTDFVSGSDKLLLDDDIFTALGTTGTTAGVALANAAVFQAGSAANDAGDRLIYDQASGALYYDADGTGATAQIQIALLGAGTTLVASDILVIA